MMGMKIVLADIGGARADDAARAVPRLPATMPCWRRCLRFEAG